MTSFTESVVEQATWAAAGESETLELKRTTGERREATPARFAMLNHRGAATSVSRCTMAALKSLGLVRSSGWGRGARWELAGQ